MKTKKLLAIILCLVLAVSLFSVMAMATEESAAPEDDLALDGAWSSPSYTWVWDAAKDTYTCTASATYSGGGPGSPPTNQRTQTQTVVATKVVTPATCTAAGKTTYTATFSWNRYVTFATQTKDAPINAIGHSWGEVSYEWTETATGYECTATHICTRDNAHFETETVTGVKSVKLAATCEATGTDTYTATFTKSADFTTQTKDVTTDAIGHAWGEVSYVWTETETGYDCTATRTCANDATHVETETVTGVKSVKLAATCEATGTDTYTATFENTAFAEQTKDVTTDAIGHIWGEVTYVWTPTVTGYECTATHICTRDNAHFETETVTGVKSVKLAATCEATGTDTYTATFTKSADFTTQTKDVTTDAIGHAWGEVSYVWTETETGYDCTATRTCANDATHVETETVTGVKSVKLAATCEATGTDTYTATFENTAFAEQTKDVTTDAIGHAWGDPVYSWGKNDKGEVTCTATRTCANDATHTETETVVATYVVTKPATTGAAGEGTYTATFANGEVFVEQTKVEEIEKLAPTTTSTPTSPKTGDDSAIALWVCVALTCGVGAAGAVHFGKKKEN